MSRRRESESVGNNGVIVRIRRPRKYALLKFPENENQRSTRCLSSGDVYINISLRGGEKESEPLAGRGGKEPEAVEACQWLVAGGSAAGSAQTKSKQ